VAILTGRGKELGLRFVARIRRLVVIRLMASNAGCRQCRVVVVDVAIRADARRHGVRSGKGEGRVAVIESRIGPHGCIVADFASGGKSSRRVRRIVCAGIVFLMARIAQRAVQRVVIADVAVGANPRRHQVGSSQLEAGCRVIEGAVAPLHRIVASFAGGRECRRNMIHRRLGVVVVGLMAGDARRPGQVVVVVQVAIRALPWRNHMGASQRKAGAVVIEARVQLGRRAVAGVARLRKISSDMVRIVGSLVVL